MAVAVDTPDALLRSEANRLLMSDDDEPPEEDQYGRMAYLQKCTELGISPASQVLKFLETEEMHIHHYGLGLKGTLAIVEALKVNSLISSVRLTNNNIPDEGLCALVEVLCTKPHVVDLDLSGNKIGTSTCKALATWLGKRGVPLCSLQLHHTHMSDKDGAALCACLEHNDGLRVLDLAHNALADKTAAVLATVLATNLVLMDLNLSWNQLRSKGVLMLAEGLAPNLSLQLLGLAWCGMQDAGAEAFGDMLKINQALADVDLSGNQVTLMGFMPLAAGIAASTSLAAIALDNNDAREEGGQKLLEAAQANEGLVKMRLDNTNTSYELRTTVEELLAPRPRSWYSLKKPDDTASKAVEAQHQCYSARLKQELDAHPESAIARLASTPPSSLTRRQQVQSKVQKYQAGSDGQCNLTVLPTASSIATHLVRVLPYVQQDPHNQLMLCFFGYLSNLSELADRVHGMTAYGHEDTGAATTNLVLGLYRQIHGIKEEKLFLSELQGRYAFFLYDGVHKQALAARDPSGEQALYYCINRDTGVISFTNSLEELAPGSRAKQWREVPPGHFVSGRSPELRQFALTPQQLELRERHESGDIGFALDSDSGDGSSSHSHVRGTMLWDS